MGIDSTTDDSCAKYCSISHSFSLWMRLYVDRKCIIFKLVTYTMNSDAKKRKKGNPPLKLHRFAACGEVWNMKKKMHIPGSLSLSSIGEESERRGQRELAHGWDQPPRLSSPTAWPTILGGVPPYDSTCTLWSLASLYLMVSTLQLQATIRYKPAGNCKVPN